MASVRQIRLEPLEAVDFSPFGTVLAARPGPASFERPKLQNWRLPFVADAAPRLQIMRYHRQPMRFSRLERHRHVSETRCPLGGAAAVLIVAGAADGGPPEPGAVRALRLHGLGVMLHPGVWHGLDCYPLDADDADFLFLSDSATEDEIEALGAPVSGLLTDVVDFARTHSIVFEVGADERAQKSPAARSGRAHGSHGRVPRPTSD